MADLTADELAAQGTAMVNELQSKLFDTLQQLTMAKGNTALLEIRLQKAQQRLEELALAHESMPTQ